ncbi:MAG TPA: lysophospholipid acyltransferase family protein [Burkholderiales bacterium]|nr:lysophospholipid acyltransferase family protein [Burkholderiales bacterium]
MLNVLMRAIAVLPLRALHAVGALLGWLVYFVSPTYRRHLRENLAAAGYQDAAVRHAAIAAAGKMVSELPAIWFRPRAALLARVHGIEGESHIEAARAAGKGVIFLTAHLGCFEVTAQLAATRMPITVLYRPPKQDFLQPLIEQGRAQHNVRLAPASLGGVRELIAALKRGEAVGILPDQVPSAGEGAWADFFGRPAYTMTLAIRLAARADSVTLLAFGERLPRGAGYVVHVRPMPAQRPDESPARWLNRALEDLIRSHPGQYLWGYNRYKTPRGAARA